MRAESAENNFKIRVLITGVKMGNPACRIVLCCARDCYRIEKSQANGPGAAVTEVPESSATSAI
jgi:hypothetical protein